MAIRSMRHRQFRTFLTVLGILIGITTFTALMSVGVGLRTQMYQILSQFAGASMIVMSKISSTRPSIPNAVVDYLEQIEGINNTVGVIEDFADVNGQMVMLTGIDSEEMEFLMGLKTVSGDRLSQAKDRDRACVIDVDLQENLGLHVNDLSSHLLVSQAPSLSWKSSGS